ncbi:MAG: ATP-dependent Clp protease ATP-binding subunit [Thermodesulfobacteriota bacterium]|nr:ATP-dependent Clp protease ATP-binding subunit [Thermodesulfobacteriota bacterium]
MRRLDIHTSLQFVWAIANIEACLSGSPVIKPVHFLVAILKIIDEAFHQDARDMGLPPHVIEGLGPIITQGRKVIGIPDDEITSARRGLRKLLHQVNGGRQVNEMLHRSKESRYLFQEAGKQALEEGSEELTLVHLLRQIMEHLPDETSTFFKNRTASPTHSLKSDDQTMEPGDKFEREVLRKNTPTLDQIGRDLTKLAREQRLTPVVGRKAEMLALARYLQRTTKRNVILLGEAGVGKTAVVEGLVQKLASENAPEALRSTRVIQISAADLVSGTQYRGAMEKRVQQIVNEASADPNLVLFIDEIHMVIKAGSVGEGSMDISNILKPALARNDFRCIGATTIEEFERHIKTETAFMRRFQVLRVNEPTEEESIQICREWARRIEGIQQVLIEDEAVVAAVDLSSKLIRGRWLPDKAIDLLENASAFVKISSLSFRNVLPAKEPPRIGRSLIESVLEEQYGISVSAAKALDATKVEFVLRSLFAGQDQAITDLVEALGTLETRELGTSRPLGIFMFTGPTGVGKTFAAECIAKALFGDSRTLGRFNMSEYKERHELARLIGAPPGFIGHEQQGALFRYVEGHPQGLILLDEMEKAHPEIQDYFLQIFDKGEARDPRGLQVDFRRQLFVITCNVTTSDSVKSKIGFQTDEERSTPDQLRTIHTKLLQHFRQEFLARIDRIIVFRDLTQEDYRTLLEREITKLVDIAQTKYKTCLEITEEAKQHISDLYVNQEEGARGFIRLLERTLVSPFSNYIKNHPKKGLICIDWSGNQLTFRNSEC